MKRIWMAMCLGIFLLTGCRQKTESVIAPADKIAISDTDFSQEKAVQLVEDVLKKQFKDRDCTVTEVVVKGNNVYGIYTYLKNDRTITQQVSLYSVSLNRHDMDDILYLQSSFGAVDRHVMELLEQKEIPLDNTVDAPVTEKEKPYDLPNVVDDPDSADSRQALEIQNSDGIYIVRFYLNAGSLAISGKHTGEGTFAVKLYDLEQNLIADMVDIEGYGEYDQTVEVPPDYYYMIAVRSGGRFDMIYEY